MSLFDFKLINTTPREVLQKYSEEVIYQHYWPEFRFGNANSPFRKDENPSFRIYQSVRDLSYRIWWADQATGEAGHVFQFVQKLYKQKGETLSLEEVCDRVCEDLHGEATITIEGTSHVTKIKRRNSKHIGQTIIQAILDDSNTIPDWAMSYWERFGITPSILDAYHVGFAKEIYLIRNKDGERISELWGASTKGNPIFFYYFPRTKHMKVYRPMEKDKRRKWISNVNNLQDVQGYHQCDIKNRKPQLLVLTKSMKDIMWLRSIGVDSMAIHGERHTYAPEFIAHLRRHCTHLISVYDNDWAGMRGALKLRELYNIPCYFYPRSTGAKDTTDQYLKDYHRLFQFISQLKAKLDADYNRYTGVGHAAVA